MNMPNLEDIREAEGFLEARFTSLRDSRDGPVFFIEHSLSEVDAANLRKTVSRVATHHPLQSSWWREVPLPLIVTATEVGYEYLGTGTDFWPKLESALGILVNPEARQSLRDLFATSSSEFRGAEPPVTPWTRAFRLIAWPITHALVPLEFRHQLSAALANLQADVQTADDDALHRAVRLAVRHPSARFDAFLEDRSHAIPVIRALLGEPTTQVSQDTVTRIDLDLTADQRARLDIAIARRRQQRMRERSSPSVETASRELRAGLLQLRLGTSGRLFLEARFPAAQGVEAEQLRQILRRRRISLSLWGVTAPVPSEQLLGGVPFPVNLHAVPDAGTPLFDELEQLEIDPDLKAILESFQLDLQLPMVFSANAEGDLARLVRGPVVSIDRNYWVLAQGQMAGPLNSFPKFGTIGQLDCYRLDSSEAHASDALRELGLRVRHGISISIAGAPPLDSADEVPRFLVGDDRIVVPKRDNPPGTMVRLGPESTLLDGNLVRARVPEGRNTLEISSPGLQRHEPFEGVRPSGGELQRICRISLNASQRTLRALLDGNVALRIDGIAPLEGLSLSVDIESGGRLVSTSLPLDTLPQVLLASEEPWLTLLDEETKEHILRDRSPVSLKARVGALAEESWVFERSVRPSWWKRGPDGRFLDSELGPLEYGVVSIASPVERPVPASSYDRSDVVLLAPVLADEVEFGPSAGFVTFCTAPATMALQAPPMQKPRLRRALLGGEGSVGMKDLAEAWLRWTLAETDTFTADIRRRQVASRLDRWVAELACGEPWARSEEEMNSPSADPWKLLVNECLEKRLGIDEFIELSEPDEGEVIRLAVTEIRPQLS